MPETQPSMAAPEVTNADIAAMLVGQMRLIQTLTERIGALEGRSSPSVTSSVVSPVPLALSGVSSEALAAQTIESLVAERLASVISPIPGSFAHHAATSSVPSTPSSAPSHPDARVFSPGFPPPPFGYPYGPHPGYYPPMYPYPHPYWQTLTNQHPAAGQVQTTSHPDDAPAVNAEIETQAEATANATSANNPTSTMSEWAPKPVSGWGDPIGDATQASPNRPAAVESNQQSNKTKKTNSKRLCNYGDKCNRSNCWFEHPGSEFDAQHDDTSNSMHASKSKSLDAKITSYSGGTSKQSSTSTKPKAECRYAERCTRKACWYAHPPGWAPPAHAYESTFDQPETNSGDQDWAATSANDEPVTGDGGWGVEDQENTTSDADNKWAAWEVKPSDDWGAPANNDWASPAAGKSTGQSSQTAKQLKKTPPTKKPETVQHKGQTDRPATSVEDVTLLVQSQVAPLTQPISDNIHDDASEPPADPITTQDPVDELPIADIVVDSLDTPSLDPVPTSSSTISESESQIPFVWGDEPLADGNREVDQLPDEQPASDEPFDEHLAEEQVDLDNIAPSMVYTSWAPVEVSGWGPSPDDDIRTADTVTTRPAEQRNKQANKANKGKGKQKEVVQGNPVAKPQRKNTNASDEAGSSTPDASAPSETPAQPVAPTTKPLPQGVPEDEIPSWLLGEGEDSYAALGLERPATPNPAPTSPKPTSNRVPMSQMNQESFPFLNPKPNYQAPKASVANGPTIRPTPSRRTGWKIISGGDSSATRDAQASSSKQADKAPVKGARKYNGQKKQNGKSPK